MQPSDPRLGKKSAQDLLLQDNKSSHDMTIENWRQCFPEIVGRSMVMRRVLETVSKVARSESSVLILGKSGTGKELISAAIHRLSPRSSKPFIPLNCSAIPEALLESELFGHEKGAFTGADRKRIGRFEEANGGTIFLDEIGDMPLSLQAKLLRVLQDMKFSPVGGNVTKEADVRIIAATNKNLELEVRRGNFRMDLYYRLNVFPINLPSLEERSDDIPDLLDHFMENVNRVHSSANPCYLTEELINFLVKYNWPGNVRQLQNLVERLVVLKGGGQVGIEDLPSEILDVEVNPPMQETTVNPRTHRAIPQVSSPVSYPDAFGRLPDEGLNLTQFIEGLENDYIRQALERTGNNKNRAAKLLGLNRTTLVERIKKRKILPLNAPSKEL